LALVNATWADDVLLGAEPVRFSSAKEKMNLRLYQSSARAIGTEIFFFRPSFEPAHGGFDVLGCECELPVGYFEDGSFNRDTIQIG
jgi:hypothetical protein